MPNRFSIHKVRAYLAGPIQEPVVSGDTIALIGLPAVLGPDGPSVPVRFVEALDQLSGINSSSGEARWTVGPADNSYSLVVAWDSSEKNVGGFIASTIGGYEFITADGQTDTISGSDTSAFAIVTDDSIVVVSLTDGTLIGFNPIQLVPKE